MAAVAALLDSSAALATLRRTLPRSHARLKTCRTARRLVETLERDWVDAVVIGTRTRRALDLTLVRARFPAVPIVLFGTVRPDEGRAVLEFDGERFAALALEGIDDAVVGDLVVRSGYLARRRAALGDLPRLLRLTEPLQRRAFELLLANAGPPPATDALARRLRVSREHLSRQFGAGGAPNLKRVIDLLQLLLARDLLENPGFALPRTVEFLGYSSPSHFRAVVRRVLRLSYAEFFRGSTSELVRRFVGGGTRSRR
ncbi:MAG: helix-turn-helix domain-containing protein [Gemmatimonadales bacterium]